MPNKANDQTPAAAFAWMIPHIQQVGNKFGYAVAVHGSMARDLDLIAVPWVEQAAPVETFVEAVRVAVGGFIRNDPNVGKYDGTLYNPNIKPHGRMAYAIQFAQFRFYIDLSVMPKVPKFGGDVVNKFRKKTAPVEAEQFKGVGWYEKNNKPYPNGICHCIDGSKTATGDDEASEHSHVHTETGVELVSVNDWIIQHTDESVSVMPPDKFEEMYELVEED